MRLACIALALLYILHYTWCMILYLAPPNALTIPFISRSRSIMLAREKGMLVSTDI